MQGEQHEKTKRHTDTDGGSPGKAGDRDFNYATTSQRIAKRGKKMSSPQDFRVCPTRI